MNRPRLDVVVPGRLDQRTGGYIYDARMVDGLRRLRWHMTVHELDGAFPEGDTLRLVCCYVADAGLEMVRDAHLGQDELGR